MNPNNLNLYIVDDDSDVRRSLVNLLVARLGDCAVRAFESGEAFLQDAVLDGSGVVILDRRMDPGLSGLEVHKILQERKSPLVVVFLSTFGDIPVVVRAMQEGAVSWLEKGCSDEQVLQTVEAAKARAKEIAASRRDRYAARQRWSQLTPREKQSCALIAPGKTAKEAASLLTKTFPDREVDHRTVEQYRAKAFAKLGVKNSNELLMWILSNGLWEDAQVSLHVHPGRVPE